MTTPDSLLIAALEASNLAHTIASVEGDMPLTYVNAAFLELTGFERSEVLGRNCRFLRGPDTDPVANRRIREALEAREAIEIDLVNHRKDGTPFLNHLNLSPVRDGRGTVVAYVGIQSDVTRLRQRLLHDQQLEHLAALGRSVTHVSHEIKNALQPVRLMAETLAAWRDLGEEDLARCLDVLGNGVRVALGVADDVLQSVRRAPPVTETVGVGALAAEVAPFLSGLLPPSVALRWDGPAPALADRTVPIRPRHFLQVLSNLVANALDAMDRAGTLSVAWAEERVGGARAEALGVAPGLHLRVDVADTGAGMDDATLAHLFESFLTTKARGRGTGLGLMISRSIVRESGGALTARSAVGRGSVFSVHLPVRQPS